jgi:pimeloyl-ACP methyl ester carboxylesterase
MGTLRNVVLVHGGFVDGSGWQGVYESPSRDGFPVSIVQNPALSLQGDAEAIQQIIDAQDGPVVLAGHSYGGAVITEAGTHRGIRAGQGRVGQHAHRRFPGRWAAAADPAAQGRLPVPGAGQIPRIVRRGPDPQSRTSGHVDGRKLSRRYRMSSHSGNRSCSKGRPGKSSGRYHTGHSIRFESRRLAARRERNPGSSCRPLS